MFYESAASNAFINSSRAVGPCTAIGRRTAGKLGGTRASTRIIKAVPGIESTTVVS